MKNFSIKCENTHEFEGWFDSLDSLRKQMASGLVECPYCGTKAVEKMLSAPQLSTPKTQAKHKLSEHPSSMSDSAQAPAPAENNHAVMHTGDAPNMMAMRLMLKHIQQTVTSHFKDVGQDFASEARKIHSGEIEAENIYGHCSEAERAELQEEGIDIFALPDLPKDN